MKAARAAAVALLLAGFPAPSRAASLGPAAGVYGSGLGAGAAVGAERAAFAGSPAAFRPGAFGGLLHFHRPFGIEELRVLEAGAFRDGKRAGFALGCRQTEVVDFYLEQGFEAQGAFRWGSGTGFPGMLDAGAAWSWWRRELAGRAPRAAVKQGYGLIWIPMPGLRAGVMARGIPAGPSLAADWEAGWEDQGAAWQWGLEARSSRTHPGGEPVQALRFDYRKTGPADGRALAALCLRPHPSLEAVAGLASAPFQLSLGFRFAWAGADLHQSWRYHRFLGATWLASLAWSRNQGD